MSLSFRNNHYIDLTLSDGEKVEAQGSRMADKLSKQDKSNPPPRDIGTHPIESKKQMRPEGLRLPSSTAERVCKSNVHFTCVLKLKRVKEYSSGSPASCNQSKGEICR